MKKVLLLALALIFSINACVANSTATQNITSEAKIALTIASGPAIYGLYLGARKLGLKKCLTIGKGILAATFGFYAVLFATDPHAPASPTERVIGSAVCGLIACIGGHSVIEDIKVWNKGT